MIMILNNHGFLVGLQSIVQFGQVISFTFLDHEVLRIYYMHICDDQTQISPYALAFIYIYLCFWIHLVDLFLTNFISRIQTAYYKLSLLLFLHTHTHTLYTVNHQLDHFHR
ncbi:hypothetical protein CIPAW_14G058800 [Carya illinoinensis]|uniref:Uncharacterized protein n=1 Tax=Carya illinoinensis TaxID=32201 RepID=A0A8T1NH67_CARIL|nr:hypothetical protein CIPAW_14G058800 [Carya illinoinensis]